MAKLNDFPVLSFNGGLITNKSDYQMNKTEFKNTLNFDVDNLGFLERRKGFQVFGNQAASGANLAGGFTYLSGASGVPKNNFIIFDSASGASGYPLISTSLTGTITTASTSADVVSTTGFAAASTFECEGDIITYTAVASGTKFTTTAASILKTHLSSKNVNQWGTGVSTAGAGTALDARSGIYGTCINNTLYVCGYNGGKTATDGSSYTDIATSPMGLFATNYRDRIYVAGSGKADSGSHVNGDPVRFSFSNAGTAATWTSTDFFDAEDQKREMITGFKILYDQLLIFKQNSYFRYDEVQLKKSSEAVGAYNHNVIQEIDGIVYTFCPSGIFALSTVSAKKISDPIEKYIKAFYPKYDVYYGRVINNCFSGTFEKKYFLYLQDIYFPDADQQIETLLDVVLVYDTIKKNWTVYNPFTDFLGFISVPSFFSAGNWQGREALLGYDVNGYVYRLFENREVGNTGASLADRGGDIIADNINNSAGSAISCILETPFYDIGNPSWWKTFTYLRVLVEQGDFNVSYRLDKGTNITDWISLGTFSKPNKKVRLPDNQGYRISFRFTNNQSDVIAKLNGFIIEEIEAEYKKYD